MSAAEGYEGGAGGKLRTRQYRRVPATPYDRPPAAARGLRSNCGDDAAEAGRRRRSGWMSKLVDPASTLIAKGVTMLFSSPFRKQLVPLPPAESPVASCEPGKVVPDISDTHPLPEMQEQGSKCEDDSRGHSSDDSISELEQLVKQKNFTRDEYDRLTELLRSRTLDLPKEDASKRIEQTNLLPASDFKKQVDEDFPPHEDRIESSKFVGIISTPSPTSKIPEKVLASPAEVAKAYMGLRPSKVSPSSLTLRSQMLREATASPSFIGFAPKSATSKSVIHFSGVPRTLENGYTPRSQGRSAIHKMSRSTYFKGQPMVIRKDAEPIGGGYPDPSTSTQWTPVNFTLCSGKQVLKRRSSALENDLGSLGSMRRIRQKSSVVSSSEGIISETPGKFLPKENALVTVQRSFSIQKPIPLHEHKRVMPNMKNIEIQEERNGHASVPLQSREMARKILQQLDKLIPSPKTESTEAKTISKDESLPKLRLDMLHEQTLKSVADINVSKLLNMGANSKLEGSHNFHATSPRSAISPMKGMAENGASTFSETEMASQANRIVSIVTSVVETGPVGGSLDSVFAHSAAGPLQKKPAFKMQAPEDSLEQENDVYSSRDVSCPSASVKEKVELDDFKVVISETQVTKKPFTFSSQGMSTSDITFNKVVGKGVSDGPIVADKDTGFAFQVSLPPSIQCQAPVKPTLQSRAIEGLLTSSEQNLVPLFSFGSKSNLLTFSSSIMSTTDSTSLKFAARSNLEGKLIGSSTTTAVTTAPAEYTELDKAEKTQKIGDMLKLAGTSSSLICSVSTTSNSFQFVASATPRLSNGSLTSDSSEFSVSSASAASLPGNLSSSTVSASPAPVSSSSNEPSSSPTFSGLPSFQFGAGSSAVSTDSSSAVVKSTSDLGPKLFKESPFGIASSALAAVSTLSSAGTSIFGLGASAFSGSGSVFGSQAAQSGSGTSCFAQTTSSQFGSAASAFGLASFPFGFSNSAFGSSAKSFGVCSGSGPSSSLSCPAAGSVIPDSSSAQTVAAPSVFGSSSHSTVFGSTFGPSTSSTLPTFGTLSASFGSSAMLPFSISSSSNTTSSVFSFTQATATSTSSFTFTSGAPMTSAPLSPVVPSSPGNDQMNVEDSMADDTSHAATTTVVPAFGQPSGVPTPSLTFGSPSMPSGAPVFQFTALQSSAFPQSETSFQASGSFEIGGNFSMGSGGGDKSGRRIVRVRRDKHKKK